MRRRSLSKASAEPPVSSSGKTAATAASPSRKSRHKVLEGELSGLRIDLLERERELAEMKSVIEGKDHEILEKEMQVVELREVVERMTGHFETVQRTAEKANGEDGCEVEVEVEVVEDVVHGLKVAVEEAGKRAKVAQEIAEEAEEKVTGLERKVREAEEKASEAERRAGEAGDRVREAEETTHAAGVQLRAAQEALTMSKSIADTERADEWEMERERGRKRIDALQGKLAVAEESLAQAKKEGRDLQAQVKQSKCSEEAAREGMEARDVELRAASEEKLRLGSVVRQAKAWAAAADNAVKIVKDEAGTADENLNEVREALKTLEKRLGGEVLEDCLPKKKEQAFSTAFIRAALVAVGGVVGSLVLKNAGQDDDDITSL